MNDATLFNKGDLVVHPKRLEWGDGCIEQTTLIQHEGKPAQRLVVRFTHHGRVTLNTAFAPLKRKEASTNTMTPFTTRNTPSAPAAGIQSNGSSKGGWLAALEGRGNVDPLTELPDELNDPFQTLESRLRATLETYRYNSDARGLIDWAITQTGLHDPLTKYTRHDIEAAFPRYDHLRKAHLVSLVQQMKRAGQLSQINDVLKEVRLPAAREALQRAMRA